MSGDKGEDGGNATETQRMEGGETREMAQGEAGNRDEGEEWVREMDKEWYRHGNKGQRVAAMAVEEENHWKEKRRKGR
jgi:hypothetical protein